MLTIESFGADLAAKTVVLSGGTSVKVRALAAHEMLLIERSCPLPVPPMRAFRPGEPERRDEGDAFYQEQLAVASSRRTVAMAAVAVDMGVPVEHGRGPVLFADAVAMNAGSAWCKAAAEWAKRITTRDLLTICNLAESLGGPGLMVEAVKELVVPAEGEEGVRLEDGRVIMPANYDLTDEGLLSVVAVRMGKDPIAYINEVRGKSVAEQAVIYAALRLERMERRRLLQCMEAMAGK